IIQVLQGEGGTVSGLLQRTASLTTTLANRDAVIGRVITNLNTVLGTLSARDKQLNEIITQLQLFVTGLAGDRKAIGDALVSIGGLTDATAPLIRDPRPALRTDIDRLGALAGDNAGAYVRVTFRVTDGDVSLGKETGATIRIKTVLGQKYLALTPTGGGKLDGEIPLSRTASPFDVVQAVNGLAETFGQI